MHVVGNLKIWSYSKSQKIKYFKSMKEVANIFGDYYWVLLKLHSDCKFWQSYVQNIPTNEAKFATSIIIVI